MKKISLILLTIVMLFSIASCTDPQNTRRVLQTQGFTKIQITGYDFFTCSDDDFYHTGFTATSPNGQYVEGVVCQGIFKGATIRFE